MNWIKKSAERQEITNLKYLLTVIPTLIPQVRRIEKNYYIIEHCTPIKPESFSPSEFPTLCLELLQPLHNNTRPFFTAGIYKYFEAYQRGSEERKQSYISYMMSEFEKIMGAARLKLPDLACDLTFRNLIGLLTEYGQALRSWEPASGYSLLHGDLHIGNIVEKQGRFLLIDFEYVRYGLPELDTANLILSILIWYFKREKAPEELNVLYNEYMRTIEDLSLCDMTVFTLCLTLLMCLSYIRASLREDAIERTVVSSIVVHSDLLSSG